MKTVADQFDETLAAAGVKRIYGIMLKAIMSGRTDEIIDLAKTKLWR
jgi:thiamine pyrophosphate-dependent acetolactate synthase large subunit-like protein